MNQYCSSRFFAFSSSFLFRSLQTVLLSGILIIFGASVSYAAPGDLDTTFGAGGIVTTPVSASGDLANALVIQADGKIILAGSAGFPATGSDFALVRYHPDGTLDASFGTNGVVTTALTTGSDSISAVALQTDGKIVAAGAAQNGTLLDFALVRYHPSGALDPSFGTNGTVITPFGTGNDRASAVIIQADGKIVAVGTSDSGNSDFALIRYHPDGSLDTSFGTGGKVATDFGNSTFDAAGDALIQPDGKIVAAGYTLPTGSPRDFALARYNPNGTLDTSFGNGGTVITSFGSDADTAYAVALQTDGKLVVAGESFDPAISNYTFALIRYNSNGALDASFGSGGKVATDFSPDTDTAFAVTVQSNGRIVAAGRGLNGTTNDFALARYTSNGTLDASFGTGGKLFTPFGSGTDEAYSAALQPDGKIVAAGRGTVSGAADFAVARYLGDPVAVRPAAFDFDGDGRTDYGVFRPSEGIWYLQNSQTGFGAVRFGLEGDKLVPSDFDGDGKTDIAVYRAGTWYLLRSQSGFAQIQFGLASDVPIPSDYDGDGKADLAIYRPSSGQWWISRSSDNQISVQTFGLADDKPVPADFDGDGKADLAVFRASEGRWYLLQSTNGLAVISFGVSTDKPVMGDYDGDGKADIAIFRPTDGNWWRRFSSSGAISVINFGISNDRPVAGDYDGDGKTDVAVWRATDRTFYLLRSGSGNAFSAFQFGLASDLPLANAFVP